jgi:glycosyltransferase involved in cell wall biosynthesis
MPAISAIIPAYNRRDFVGAAIDSALAQTGADLEVIVVDDGSTDGTADFVRREHAGRATLIALPENSGLPAVARNAGIKASSGKWIAFLDSDDRWAPDKLARQAPLLERTAIGLLYSKAEVVEPGGKPTGEIWGLPCGENSFATFLDRSCVPNSTAVVSREALDSVGGLSEDPGLRGVEDYDLWLRIAAKFPVRFMNETTCYYCAHNDSISAADRLMLDARIRVYDSLDDRIPNWRGLAPDFNLDAKIAGLHLEIGRRILESKGDSREMRARLRSAFKKSPGTVLRCGRGLIYRSLLGETLFGMIEAVYASLTGRTRERR